MESGNFIMSIIYFIFILMSICYFYLFWRDKTMKHVYLSLTPTFLCVYRLMNHRHYEPEIISRRWMVWILISLFGFVVYWLVLTLVDPKKRRI